MSRDGLSGLFAIVFSAPRADSDFGDGLIVLDNSDNNGSNSRRGRQKASVGGGRQGSYKGNSSGDDLGAQGLT